MLAKPTLRTYFDWMHGPRGFENKTKIKSFDFLEWVEYVWIRLALVGLYKKII